MFKKSIAIFFTILFLALISAPSVIVALNDSFDTSIFYSITEEEESGKVKNLVYPFSLLQNDGICSFLNMDNQYFVDYFKEYAKPYLNIISPPPEQGIL